MIYAIYNSETDCYLTNMFQWRVNFNITYLRFIDHFEVEWFMGDAYDNQTKRDSLYGRLLTIMTAPERTIYQNNIWFVPVYNNFPCFRLSEMWGGV